MQDSCDNLVTGHHVSVVKHYSHVVAKLKLHRRVTNMSRL